jgi:proteic killer suppression protein
LIQNFRHKGLAQLYNKASRKGLPPHLVPKIERILARLDVVTEPEMMNLPGLQLHPLRGKLKGFWSVWVSGNWRIIFSFCERDVVDVDLVDYH